MKQKKTVEDYLKTIYILSQKKDVHGAYKLPKVYIDNKKVLLKDGEVFQMLHQFLGGG